jgi:COMPASS component SWD3
MEKRDDFDITPAANMNRKMYKRGVLGDSSSAIQSVRFDPQDKYLAAGCEDGTIKIYNVSNSKLVYTLNQKRQDGGSEEEKIPSTCIRWRPTFSSAYTKNVLISVHSDGSVQHWHTTSGKSLHKLYSPHNPLYCADFSPDGRQFATAGRDFIVRIYDETTKALVTEFTPGGAASPGHSSRIFSVKYYIEDPNILISGGWDSTVQVWDMREGSAVRAIFGPFVCGDSLDISRRGILAGSWREKEQLQIFDLGTGELLNNIDWDGGVGIRRSPEPCQVYAAQYNKDPKPDMIIAGGNKSNEARGFDFENNCKPFAAVMDLPEPVFSVDFSHNGNFIALGCADGYIRLLNISKTI